jgi:GNAT superfamily N-acetyltransferase
MVPIVIAAIKLRRFWGILVMEEITAKEACAFSETEHQDFLRLVRQGGEVGDAVLESNVRNAKCLVFLRSASALIGIAALKNPRQGYRQRISAETGVEISAASYPYELGYVFITEGQRRRGLSRRLADAALASADGLGVFATSREDNAGMHSTLGNCGFSLAGKPYTSRDRSIRLFLREAG